MRSVHFVVTLLCLSWFVSDAAAQTGETRRFELGTTAASACLNRQSYCGGKEAMIGFYGSYWITHHIEIGGRIARIAETDVFDVAIYNVDVPPDRISIPIGIRDRSRLYVVGHIYRHIGSDPRIRPYVGVAVGAYKYQWTSTCEAPGCEEALTRLDPMQTRGRRKSWPPDVAPGVGVSGRAGLLQWRTGINFHLPDDDSASATEFFAGAGFRF
jgi:hypothetical protein